MEFRRVYMDNNATTPLHPDVKRAMAESFDLYGNPSSMHGYGREAAVRIEDARRTCADFIHSAPEEIIFTGCGSESNNTILKLVTCNDKACKKCPAGRMEIITSVIEHPSVLNTVQLLEERGRTAKYVPVDETGKVDIEWLEREISDRTAIVSVMMANNEIGTIQDIRTVSEIAHRHGALMHTDGVQAVGKIPVDVKELGVDFLSFSGHKVYGPKGVGGLYVRNGSPYCTLIHGGHQEHGRRAGTYNTLGIIGMGRAVAAAAAEMDGDAARIRAMRDRLRDGIIDTVPDIRVNGHPTDVLPGTLDVSFRGAEGEAILLYLDLEGIAVSTGSACASGSLDPSHVLIATGVGPEYAHGSIRFSLGAFNTEEDVSYVLEKVPRVIARIRSMSSIYKA